MSTPISAFIRNFVHPFTSRFGVVALLALGTAAAQAVPVAVAINGLPAGLSPSLEIKRSVCLDGLGFATNPLLTLTERQVQTLERVSLPFGQVQVRFKLVTQYVGSIDTPVTPSNQRCSVRSMAPDTLQLTVLVPGLSASGLPQLQRASLGSFAMDAPVNLNTTLSAATTGLDIANQAQDTLPRGMLHTVRMAVSASAGSISLPSLDLARPMASNPLLFLRAARLFQDANGRACLQVQTTSRCLGDVVGPLVLGGVQLHAVQRNGGVVTFQFTLQQDFALGTLRLTGQADASDLAFYAVDGSFEALDLLPWKSQSLTATVQ